MLDALALIRVSLMRSARPGEEGFCVSAPVLRQRLAECAVMRHAGVVNEPSNVYENVLGLRQADSAVVLLTYRGDW